MEQTPTPIESGPVQPKEQLQQQPETTAPVVRVALSSKTILLIVALALLTVFFLLLALIPVSHSKPAQITLAPTPTPFAQSMLGMEQGTTGVTPQTQQLNVIIETGANVVTAVQLAIGFDPQAVTNVDITPGDFLPSPVQLEKHIDTKTGTIFYALGITPTSSGVKGRGVVATLTFSQSPQAKQNSTTTFTFSSKTLVAAEGVTQSVLKQTKAYTLFLAPTAGIPQ